MSNKMEEIVTEIRAHLEELKNSDALAGEPADIAINAPLALVQCNMEGQVIALEWVLRVLEASNY